MAVKLEEVEGGDLLASTLDEVGCVKDDLHGQLQSSLDSGGRLRIIKEKKKAKMPVNSEELRAKIKIECNTMLMLAARFRNKTWFNDLSTKTFQRYVDFLLGEKIFQLQIPKGDGSAQTMSANPSWDLMINFEHKLRKEAYRRTSREGKPLNVDAWGGHGGRDSEGDFLCDALDIRAGPAQHIDATYNSGRRQLWEMAWNRSWREPQATSWTERRR